MNYKIIFRPEIEFDLIGGIEWYDEKSSGLGQQFREMFEQGIDTIQSRPLSIAKAPNGLRSYQMKQFPFLIHFRVKDDEILVVAVMRATRDENAYQDRG